MRTFTLLSADETVAAIGGVLHDSGRVTVEGVGDFDSANAFKVWLDAQKGLFMEADD